ncbi:hypothetical protein [Pseudomonas sp. 31 R 17]|uniref:hypothetical protein n=1 Tax=unclassified Pseudomonas TaxID=196821 RepID=UPI00081278A7|nr:MULTISPECIES: hypothetical protein [unclassified Pseudomonas]CRM11215.1 hypothetical protein [Pseudomonas sp. 28 E 9]CRM14374.1 hypothetical protein [Pseudomonas sp. 31 R 17]
MSSLQQLIAPSHRFDLQLSPANSYDEIELFVEELSDSLHFASDCASSIGSASTTGGCAGGCVSSASTVGTLSCIISTGS